MSSRYRCGARGHWAPAPASSLLTVDVDSFIGEVHGHAKQGTGYGYTHKLGYHPILARRADTGEVLHVRLRKGQANTQRGARRGAARGASSTSCCRACAAPARPVRSCCAPTRDFGIRRASLEFRHFRGLSASR
ncbi:MAG: hypothetical protein ACR2LK_15570 [Solirubrobacteraceae bacterium]